MGLLRRDSIPADVRARIGLERGERVLARVRADSGTYLVATDRAVLFVPPDGDVTRRVPWASVHTATWDRDTSALTVVTESGDRHVAVLPAPGRLPELARERVMATILVSQHVPLAGRRGVRITARRQVGTSELTWALMFDAGLDPDDPGLRAAAEQALTELRATTGA